MKSIDHYQYPAVITLLPFPLRHCNVLRIEVNPSKLEEESYPSMFKNLRYVFANLGFNVSVDKNLGFNQTDLPNVMEFVLPLYANEVEIAKDLTEALERKEFFGENSVLNRVIIKKELRK